MSAWPYKNFSHRIILLQNSRWQDIEDKKQIQKFQSTINMHAHSALHLVVIVHKSCSLLIMLGVRFTLSPS